MLPLFLLADSRLPSGGHGHSGGVEALVDRGLLRSVDDLALFLDGRIRTGGRVVAAAAAAACALAGASGSGGTASGGCQQGGTADVQRQQGGTADIPAGAADIPAGAADIPAGAADIPAGAAQAATTVPDWEAWDAAVSVRTPSAALRAASRAQGAALLRTVSLAFPTPAVAALRGLPRVHHPLVLGVAAAAAGADPAQAAALALHHLIGGASTAAVRLLGLDPLRVAAVSAAVARAAEPVAVEAATRARAAVAAADPGLLPAEGSPLTDVLAELHRASEATLFAS
jgi:urease accessory protein